LAASSPCSVHRQRHVDPRRAGGSQSPREAAHVPEVLVHSHHSQLHFSGLGETHSPLQLLMAQMTDCTLIFIRACCLSQQSSADHIFGRQGNSSSSLQLLEKQRIYAGPFLLLSYSPVAWHGTEMRAGRLKHKYRLPSQSRVSRWVLHHWIKEEVGSECSAGGKQDPGQKQQA